MKSFGVTIVVLSNAFIALGCGEKRHAPATNAGARSKGTERVDVRDTSAAAETLAAQLEEAYRLSSDDLLAAFFRRWHESVRPVDVDEVTDPSERELHALYLAFFRPNSLDEMAGHFLQDSDETYDDTYRDVDYLIVPTSLHYRVDGGEEQTLTDFRPRVQFENTEVVFLTPAYRKALESFLDGDSRRDAASDSEELDARTSDVVQRLEFLNRNVKVTIGHWEGWDPAAHSASAWP